MDTNMLITLIITFFIIMLFYCKLNLKSTESFDSKSYISEEPRIYKSTIGEYQYVGDIKNPNVYQISDYENPEKKNTAFN